MSSNKYVTPLRFDLKPSKKLLVFILGIHGLALITLFVLPLWYAVALGVAICLSLAHSLEHQGYIPGRKKIDRLIWGSDNLWTLVRNDGAEMVAELKPDACVNPYIVILCLAVEGRWLKRGLVIMSDAIEESAFRQLRVRLNTQA